MSDKQNYEEIAGTISGTLHSQCEVNDNPAIQRAMARIAKDLIAKVLELAPYDVDEIDFEYIQEVSELVKDDRLNKAKDPTEGSVKATSFGASGEEVKGDTLEEAKKEALSQSKENLESLAKEVVFTHYAAQELNIQDYDNEPKSAADVFERHHGEGKPRCLVHYMVTIQLTALARNDKGEATKALHDNPVPDPDELVDSLENASFEEAQELAQELSAYRKPEASDHTIKEQIEGLSAVLDSIT